MAALNICESSQMCGEAHYPFSVRDALFKASGVECVCAVYSQTHAADVYGVNCWDLKVFMCPGGYCLLFGTVCRVL